MPGSQRFFCSSVPNLLMIVPLMAGETTISSSAAAAGRQLLHDQRQLVHAGAAAAVLLGQVDPEEAEFACLVPQLGRCARRRGPSPGSSPGRSWRPVAATALRSACCSSVSMKLIGLSSSPARPSTRARTVPTSTCWPAVDIEFGEHAGGRGGDGVLHLHGLQPDSGWPAVDRVADRGADPDDRAGHRGEQRALRRPRSPGRGSGAARQAHRAERRSRRTTLVAVAGDVEGVLARRRLQHDLVRRGRHQRRRRRCPRQLQPAAGEPVADLDARRRRRRVATCAGSRDARLRQPLGSPPSTPCASPRLCGGVGQGGGQRRRAPGVGSSASGAASAASPWVSKNAVSVCAGEERRVAQHVDQQVAVGARCRAAGCGPARRRARRGRLPRVGAYEMTLASIGS